MALPTTWHEIERSHDRGVADAAFWTGVRRYVGPKGADQILASDFLDDDTWTTKEQNGVVMIPRRLRNLTNAREGGVVSNIDCAEIEVLYRSAYNPITHPVGSATLSVSTRPLQYRQKEDTGELVIEGPHKTQPHMFYRVVEGSNVRFKHLSVLQIRTAYSVATTLHRTGKAWNTYMDRLDKINGKAMPKLGIGIGQARLIGVDIPKYFLYNSVITHVPINYSFWYSDVHWNELYDDGTNKGTCRSKKYYRGPKAVPVIDNMDMSTTESLTYIHKDTLAVGAAVGNAKLVIRTVDIEAKMASGDNNGYRDLFKEDTTFDDLDTLLWWAMT